MKIGDMRVDGFSYNMPEGSEILSIPESQRFEFRNLG